METHQTLYQNENRAISLTVLDQDKAAFDDIQNATYSVKTDSGTSVIPDQSAFISDNVVYCIIGTTTTASVGDYQIVWKLIDSNGYIYYHKTSIEVLAL